MSCSLHIRFDQYISRQYDFNSRKLFEHINEDDAANQVEQGNLCHGCADT